MKKIVKLLPLVGLISIVLLSFYPFLINGGFIGDFGDPIAQTIPNKFLLLENIKNGLLPLWNPYSFFGFPLLADIQVGTFYFPDIIIFSVFPLLLAHNISLLLHLIFAAIGTYLFTKEFTKNKLISFSIALVLILGGTFLTKIVYLNFIQTISYLPWILLILSFRNSKIWILAIFFTLMIFAGHPIALFYSMIVISVFILFNCIKKWKAFILSFLLALIIASVQIFPFIELKMNSVRDSLSYAQFIEGSLSFTGLFGFLSPFRNGMLNHFDMYIHFGVVAFILLIVSFFFFHRYKGSDRKLYLTGIVLCLFGLVLSLGGNVAFISEFLYKIPLFNLIRVPVRYIVLFNFGAIFAIAVFLKYLFSIKKRIGIIVSVLLIANSFLLPSIFLERHEITDGEKHYLYEISQELELTTGDDFSLHTTPQYFLSSDFFLSPNRNFLTYMPSIIGYNPMLLKDYHDVFPVLPRGAFADPDYFKNYYNKYEEAHLKYYIFPSRSFLEKENLESKAYVIDFLENNGWHMVVENNDYGIWISPFDHRFAYFENDINRVEITKFSPGEIELEVEVFDNDILVINQSYYDGWVAFTDAGKHIDAEKYNGYLQSYKIPKGTKSIIVKYSSQAFVFGFYVTILGIMILIFLIVYDRKNNKQF